MKSDSRALLEPLGLKVDYEPGATVLEITQKAGLFLRADCGGQGFCGKCQVKAAPSENLSPPNGVEEAALEADQLREGYRLACQCRAHGQVTITLPAGLDKGEGALGKTGLTGQFPPDPMVSRRVFAPTGELRLEDHAMGDLVSWMGQGLGQMDLRFSRAALAGLAQPAAYKGPLTLVAHREMGVTAVWPGVRKASLGLAVDLGTTTAAGYLCDLAAGRILAAAGQANPQRRYGEDVISRIKYADTAPDNLAALSRLAVETVDALAARLLQQVGAGPEELDEVCLVGNTTMQHLFCGLSPCSLGHAPYLPVSKGALDLSAGELGLSLPAGVNVHVFPVMAGFVGGDAVAAALAEEVRGRAGSLLVVDIGTNGELVLMKGEDCWAISCATGPALEGAHISCGVRAAPGAVHKVAEDGPDALACSILGGGENPAVGLCGSGLIDAVAALRRQGRMRANGRLVEGAPGVESDEKGIGRFVQILPGAACHEGRPLRLALDDVRQLQLAKAALSVGIEIMLEQAGVDRVDTTVLTGAFGSRFNWRNAVDIGLLPKQAASGQVLAVENAAGAGAVMALVNRGYRARADELAQKARVIELSMEPEFSMRFAMGANFPEL